MVSKAWHSFCFRCYQPASMPASTPASTIRQPVNLETGRNSPKIHGEPIQKKKTLQGRTMMAGNHTQGKESAVAWDDLEMMQRHQPFAITGGGSLSRLTARVRSGSGRGDIRVISTTGESATGRAIADQASRLDEVIRRCSEHRGQGLPAWARMPARRIRPRRTGQSATTGFRIMAPKEENLSLLSLALSR